MSVDRGSTFTLIHSFMIGEFVVDYDRSEQRVAFLTNTGRLYHSRPQAYQIIETQEIDLIVQNVSQLVFDSLGELNAISVLVENRTILSTAIPLVSNDRVSKHCYSTSVIQNLCIQWNLQTRDIIRDNINSPVLSFVEMFPLLEVFNV